MLCLEFKVCNLFFSKNSAQDQDRLKCFLEEIGLGPVVIGPEILGSVYPKILTRLARAHP